MPAAALDYTISGNWVFGGATGSQGGFGGTLGRFAVNTVDGIVDQFGEIRLSRSWSVLAAFLHYWTPQLRSGFSVGYSNVEYPNANTLFVGGVIPGTVLTPRRASPRSPSAASPDLRHDRTGHASGLPPREPCGQSDLVAGA